MKVGIFSPYFETFGGGERYILSAAEFFLQRGDAIDIFWKGGNAAAVKQYFAINLDKANFLDNTFSPSGNLPQRIIATSKYDLMFFLSDGSIPTSFARENILHFQTPFHYHNQRTLPNKLKLSRFKAIVCNSYFTKRYIDTTYGIDSLVLYPPVDVKKFTAGKKEKIILSVGHFYSDIRPKRQDAMVKTFMKLVKDGLSGWKLVLIGGVHNSAQDEVEKLRVSAQDYPVEFITNSTFEIVKDYYSRATIYWHAAGFGINIEKFPEKAEHFGMSTVEAMSAGDVPIVFAGGGQKEIVTEAENGFFWTSEDELIKKTLRVIKDKNLQKKLSQNARERSQFFSKERFFQELGKIVSKK